MRCYKYVTIIFTPIIRVSIIPQFRKNLIVWVRAHKKQEFRQWQHRKNTDNFLTSAPFTSLNNKETHNLGRILQANNTKTEGNNTYQEWTENTGLNPGSSFMSVVNLEHSTFQGKYFRVINRKISMCHSNSCLHLVIFS